MRKFLIEIGLSIFTFTGVKAQVVLQALEGNNTLEGDAYILSVHDDHYYPWEESDQPIGYGTIEQNFVPAASMGTDPLMDYQGKLGPIGSVYEKKIAIPYTCEDNQCNYRAIEKVATISHEFIANSDEDKAIKLILKEGNVSQGKHSLIATIGTVEDEVLNFVQLDLNKGLGTNKKGVLITEFKNSNDYNQELKVRVYLIPGILDKYFYKKTNEYAGGTESDPEAYADWAADEYEHQFAYLPVNTPGTPGTDYKDEKLTWLNNNLGAEYSDIHSPYFNPAKQSAVAYSETEIDIRSIGSLFEWQRKADGHELFKYNELTKTYDRKYYKDAKDIVLIEQSNEYYDYFLDRAKQSDNFFVIQVNPDKNIFREGMRVYGEVKKILGNHPDYNPTAKGRISVISYSWYVYGIEEVPGSIEYKFKNYYDLSSPYNPPDLWGKDGKTNPCPQGFHVPNFFADNLQYLIEGDNFSYFNDIAVQKLALPHLNLLEDLITESSVRGGLLFKNFGAYATSGPYKSGYGPDGDGHIFILSRSESVVLSSSYGLEALNVYLPVRCIKD